MYATEPPSVVTALDRRSGQAALDLVARILLHAAGEQEENDLGASAGRPVYRALQAHCRPRSRAERKV